MTGEKLVKRVIELHEIGKSKDLIAQQLAVSVSRISRILDRYRKRSNG